MNTHRTRFHVHNFMIGILFLMAAIIAFVYPVDNLMSIIAVFGALAIAKGIYEIYVKILTKEIFQKNSNLLVIFGILDILIGLSLLFNLTTSVQILPYIFATWFIIDSILGLFKLDLARIIGSGYYWFTLIINILGIMVGISLLFDPIASALTLSFLIGLYFMMIAIANFIATFQD